MLYVSQVRLVSTDGHWWDKFCVVPNMSIKHILQKTLNNTISKSDKQITITASNHLPQLEHGHHYSNKPFTHSIFAACFVNHQPISHNSQACTGICLLVFTTIRIHTLHIHINQLYITQSPIVFRQYITANRLSLMVMFTSRIRNTMSSVLSSPI